MEGNEFKTKPKHLTDEIVVKVREACDVHYVNPFVLPVVKSALLMTLIHHFDWELHQSTHSDIIVCVCMYKFNIIIINEI